VPRIRTIKPEFWQDYRLSRMPPIERLVFLCLISMSDDFGRVEGDEATVRNFGFPSEQAKAVKSSLDNLCKIQRITIYENNGVPFIAINNFEKHQVINKKALTSKLPSPNEDYGSTTVVLPEADGTATGRIKDQGSRKGTGIKEQGNAFMALWNDKFENTEVPKIQSITDVRLRHLKARFSEKAFDQEKIIDIILNTRFLRGDNDRGWKTTFDWVIEKENNYVKILEGQYSDSNAKNSFDESKAILEEYLKDDRSQQNTT